MDQVPRLNSEAQDLRAVENIIQDSIKQYESLKKVIVEYSEDVNTDLLNLKSSLVEMNEVKKDLSALLSTIGGVEAKLPSDLDIDAETLLQEFNDFHVACFEDQFTEDSIEHILTSVDSYIQNRESQGESEDLLVTSVIEHYTDPLTKKTLQYPVKSKKCKHHYEKQTILQYLEKHKRCPYAGCVEKLCREDLVDDLELTRKLRSSRDPEAAV